MNFSELHLEEPLWLWLLLIIPLAWIFYYFFYHKNSNFYGLNKFIDQHLLPYLLVNASGQRRLCWKNLLLWIMVWTCLVLAIAGPRWNFHEIETFSKDQSLVIILDLSESMNASDVKPSRLVRSKQKIEDVLNLAKGVKIGLIAFAADAHMMTPVTEDKETIRYLLPSISTDLISVQGSKLTSALKMAEMMLKGEVGTNQALLLISDGGFEDASAVAAAKKLAEKGIVIHTMGVGTVEGAPLRDREGNLIKKNGTVVLSKLEKEVLQQISHVGNGHYLHAYYSDKEERAILDELAGKARTQIEHGKKTRFWEERFYLLVLPVLPMLLLWFKRGYLFLILFCFLFSQSDLQAYSFVDCFKNHDERAKQVLDAGDYEAASSMFQDDYRKGVAYYRAGKFDEAEKAFRQSTRPEVASHAAYNLGNSLAQQKKFEEAIAAYEEVLSKWPDHKKAKENLELVKKMLEEQKKQSPSSESSESDRQDQRNQQENRSESQAEESNDLEDQKENSPLNDKGEKKESSSENQKQESTENSQHRDQREDQNELDKPKQVQESIDDFLKEKEKETKSEDYSEKAENNLQGIQKETEDFQDGKETQDGQLQEQNIDADLWFNRLENDPKKFLQNKFFLESKNNRITQGIDPW